MNCGAVWALRKLLEKASKANLIDFLVEYAEYDGRFKNAVHVCFASHEYAAELSKIEAAIAEALAGTYDDDKRDRWGWVSFDISDIVWEIERRTKQGHIRLAFAEIELLYRKLLENFEYQGECEISMEAERCLDLMAVIAGKSDSSEDREFIFKQCVLLSAWEEGRPYGADYKDRLLGIASSVSPCKPGL